LSIRKERRREIDLFRQRNNEEPPFEDERKRVTLSASLKGWSKRSTGRDHSYSSCRKSVLLPWLTAMAQPLEEYDEHFTLFGKHVMSTKWSFVFWQVDMFFNLVFSIVSLSAGANAFTDSPLTLEVAWLVGFGGINLSMIV